VIAVLAAGLTLASAGWRELTPTGRLASARSGRRRFGVNSVVFLLIGLQVDVASLGSAPGAIVWGLAALTLGRIAAVYPLLSLLRPLGQAVPASWQHLLVWANLKAASRWRWRSACPWLSPSASCSRPSSSAARS